MQYTKQVFTGDYDHTVKLHRGNVFSPVADMVFQPRARCAAGQHSGRKLPNPAGLEASARSRSGEHRDVHPSHPIVI